VSDEHKSLWIDLTVHDREGNEVQRKRLDFLTRSGRQNLAKTAWWAMHEGLEVRTRPLREGS